MANPAAERTTINVKGVREDAWATARRCAMQRGLPMGEWLSAAIETAGRIQAGDQVAPPSGPDLARALADLAPALPVLPAMTAEARRAVSRIVAAYSRQAMGFPPPALRGGFGGKEPGNPPLLIGSDRAISQEAAP